MGKRNNDIAKFGEEYVDAVGKKAYNNDNVTVKNRVLDYSDKFDTMQLCFISDLHIGSSDFNIRELMKNLEYAISQENSLVFFLGDIMNTAIVGSKSDPYEDILSPQGQLDTFQSLLKIAKGDNKLAKVLQTLDDTGKIAIVHSGNHENRVTKAVGLSPAQIAADYAGVGEAYAPFYANTDIVIRQNLCEDGKFHFNVVTHHGTGMSNIDATKRMMKSVSNGDAYVAGHTHKYCHTMDRTIKVGDDGNQYYHDVLRMSLPASGGGTYGAGMALPDIPKQSAVWMVVTSQPNPYAGLIAPNGIRYEDVIPACAFFTPTIELDTHIKEKRMNQAKKIIEDTVNPEQIESKIDEFIAYLINCEKNTRKSTIKKISERSRKKPKGFEEWLESKNTDMQETNSLDNNDKELGD